MSGSDERTKGDTAMLTTAAGGGLVARKVRIAVVEGPDAGAVLEIDGGSRIVGTGPSSDLRLKDSRVSRSHLEISLLPRGVALRDLDSRNGTFVGDAIVHRLVLPTGGLVRLGKSTTLEIVPADVPATTPPRSRFGELVAASASLAQLLGVLARVAASDVPVLLQGEPGVGKTAAAIALHAQSGRRGELVVIDLATDPTSAEVRAAAARAAGGTLVFERVDRAPASLLSDLVAALEARERADAERGAVVSTSREDVRALVEAGAFPRELWFHLAGVHLTIPPLRDRPEDAAPIADAIRARHGHAPSPAELADLRRQGFPGNAHGLRLATPGTNAPPAPLPTTFKEAKDRMVAEFERDYLERLLAEHGGNVSAAARTAKIARSHLVDLIKKHGLDPHD